VAEVVAARGRGGTVDFALAHAGGGVGSVTVSLSAPAFRFGVELWGPAGLTRLPDGGSPEEAYACAVSELLEAARTNVPHPCDARFAAEIVRILAAAERFLARPGDARGERPDG
jgi:hypothetical protein